MTIDGNQLIGFEQSNRGTRTFQAVNPADSSPLEPRFFEATSEEADRTLEIARAAHSERALAAPSLRAALLHKIADEIEALGDVLIERAQLETALPKTRLEGERARTTGQLRLFAKVVEEGTWVDARIDRAEPSRTPLPKPDIRRMLEPLGPVVVFGAGNFPLAFSVAGGDTASALAAGNPVVVKAHPGHPGTSELVGKAILKALQACGLDGGVFSLLQSSGHEVGVHLVRHALTRAVGFTGSLKGGRALFDAAANRTDPVPVYAEMGSINPVFLLPQALGSRGPEIAKGLVQSFTLGVGQFCTSPGVVVTSRGQGFREFREELVRLTEAFPPSSMLASRIRDSFLDGAETLEGLPGVKLLAISREAVDGRRTQAPALVLETSSGLFLEHPSLGEEVFGPSTVLVVCEEVGDFLEVAKGLKGQLTASVHGTVEELSEHLALIETLKEKAGRLIINGFPTGVEVCPSMQHGGPYPATTDSRTTSVGTAAIQRFARPICFQGFPEELLPDELKNKNLRKIWRLVDGTFSRDDC